MSGMRVLVAEDSDLVAERLLELIEEVDGVAVVGRAHDVPEAVRLFTELAPDAVVLDIRMPGGNGLDVLAEIRKRSLTTLVIILSNAPAAHYRARCMELGADLFFEKATEFGEVGEVFRWMTLDASSEGGSSAA